MELDRYDPQKLRENVEKLDDEVKTLLKMLEINRKRNSKRLQLVGKAYYDIIRIRTLLNSAVFKGCRKKDLKVIQEVIDTLLDVSNVLFYCGAR